MDRSLYFIEAPYGDVMVTAAINEIYKDEHYVVLFFINRRVDFDDDLDLIKSWFSDFEGHASVYKDKNTTVFQVEAIRMDFDAVDTYLSHALGHLSGFVSACEKGRFKAAARHILEIAPPST